MLLRFALSHPLRHLAGSDTMSFVQLLSADARRTAASAIRLLPSNPGIHPQSFAYIRALILSGALGLRRTFSVLWAYVRLNASSISIVRFARCAAAAVNREAIVCRGVLCRGVPSNDCRHRRQMVAGESATGGGTRRQMGGGGGGGGAVDADDDGRSAAEAFAAAAADGVGVPLLSDVGHVSPSVRRR